MEELKIKITEAIKSVVGEQKVSLHEPRFNNLEIENLKNCIDSTFVSSVGEYVNIFEKKIAKYTNSARAIAIVNGTSALQLALKLVGVKEGEEVICPSLTFVATANAISYLKAFPHFVDSDESTLGMDSVALRAWLRKISCFKEKKLINKNTGRKISAIVPMHTFGHPVDIKKIVEIADEYNLPIVEDAAESLGSFYHGKHCGTFGKLGIISFNGNKIITTGGGGMIITNDDTIADYAKHISNTAKQSHKWRYIHDQIGFNFRMPNINAALGCAQFEKLPEFIDSKRKLFLSYKSVFESIKEVKIFSEPKDCQSNYWLQTLILEEEHKNKLEGILEYTNNNGVMTRPAWDLMHTLRMFKDCPRAPLPIAESLAQRIINIPSSAFIR